MTIHDRIWDTIKLLREEIRDLKRCQVQYFTVAIMATGALLGLASTLSSQEFRGLAFLTPLGILLPCWLVFFDKATTITRIVGYQRLLEDFLIKPEKLPPPSLLGYETALSKFRKLQDEGKLGMDSGVYRPPFWGTLFLRTRHRFWMLNWYTYFVLSVLCWGLGYNFLTDRTFELRFPFIDTYIRICERDFGKLAFFFLIVVAVYTFVLIVQLVRGFHSFEGNAYAWKRVLEILEEETSTSSSLPKNDSERK